MRLIQSLWAGELGGRVAQALAVQGYQVTVLPHCAAQTSPRSAVQLVRHNVSALRAGLPLQHLVHRQQGY